jgi:hypothetical protein
MPAGAVLRPDRRRSHWPSPNASAFQRSTVTSPPWRGSSSAMSTSPSSAPTTPSGAITDPLDPEHARFSAALGLRHPIEQRPAAPA